MRPFAVHASCNATAFQEGAVYRGGGAHRQGVESALRPPETQREDLHIPHREIALPVHAHLWPSPHRDTSEALEMGLLAPRGDAT